MKTLHIEWRHLGQREFTCSRCAATGDTVEQVVDALRHELAPQGVSVTFTDTPLTAEQVPDSNSLFFNGVPIERLLPAARASDNYCGSCSAITQQETYCRTVEHGGQVYEEIPEALIRHAALAALSKEENR
jgi:hypothetical protein